MTTASALVAAVSACAVLAATTPARAAPADVQMNDTLQQYRGADARGLWVNPLMPAGTGQIGLASAAPSGPSGDVQLTQIVAAYSREQLDRGGWANAWVREDHYAAGEPLLAVRIGDGVTTRVAALGPVVQVALGHALDGAH